MGPQTQGTSEQTPAKKETREASEKKAAEETKTPSEDQAPVDLAKVFAPSGGPGRGSKPSI